MRNCLLISSEVVILLPSSGYSISDETSILALLYETLQYSDIFFIDSFLFKILSEKKIKNVRRLSSLGNGSNQ